LSWNGQLPVHLSIATASGDTVGQVNKHAQQQLLDNERRIIRVSISLYTIFSNNRVHMGKHPGDRFLDTLGAVIQQQGIRRGHQRGDGT
jgi:hypothetical protein